MRIGISSRAIESGDSGVLSKCPAHRQSDDPKPGGQTSALVSTETPSARKHSIRLSVKATHAASGLAIDVE